MHLENYVHVEVNLMQQQSAVLHPVVQPQRSTSSGEANCPKGVKSAIVGVRLLNFVST